MNRRRNVPRYRPVEARLVPRNLRWDTPSRHAGHTVVTSFGGSADVERPHDAGATWMRTEDVTLADRPRDYFRLIEDVEVELDALPLEGAGEPAARLGRVVWTRNHSAVAVEGALPDGWRVDWNSQAVFGRAMGVYTATLRPTPAPGWTLVADAFGRIGEVLLELHTCRVRAVVLAPAGTQQRLLEWCAERSVQIDVELLRARMLEVPVLTSGEYLYQLEATAEPMDDDARGALAVDRKRGHTADGCVKPSGHMGPCRPPSSDRDGGAT